MDSRKRLQNAFEDIFATTFDKKEYVQVYAVSDAGLLLNDVPGEDVSKKSTLLANLMAAADSLHDTPLVKLSVDQGCLFLHRLNNTSFLAVETSSAAKDEEVLQLINEVSRRVRNEIPWLR